MATFKFKSDSSIHASGGFGCANNGMVLVMSSNELNFGGTNNSTTIYFGYRAAGSKTIPTYFNFGKGAAAVYAGSFTAGSSREIKHDIKDYNDSAVDLLDDVKIVYYKYDSDSTEKERVGFIAEDTDPLLSIDNKHMDINTCIGVLMKAVQEIDSSLDDIGEKLDGICSNEL